MPGLPPHLPPSAKEGKAAFGTISGPVVVLTRVGFRAPFGVKDDDLWAGGDGLDNDSHDSKRFKLLTKTLSGARMGYQR